MAEPKVLINFLGEVYFQTNPHKLLALFQKSYRKDLPIFKEHKEFWKFLEKSQDAFETEHFLDASLLRNSELALFLANALITEEGKLDQEFLKTSLEFFEKERFFIANSFWYSAPRMEWLFQALQMLKEPDTQNQIKKIHKPVQNVSLDNMIRATLHLSQEHPLTDALAKRASIAAFLCDLRQHIGSCFATAPCLLIRKFRPDFFFGDVFDLMTKGSIRRVIEGKIFDLPIASSFGKGDSEKTFSLDPVLYPRKALYFFIMLLEKVDYFQEKAFLEKFFVVKHLFRRWMHKFENKTVHLKMLLQDFFLHVYNIKMEEVEKFRHMQKEWDAKDTFITAKFPNANVAKAESQYQRALLILKSITSNALLKTWEYTIASMSDVKLDMTHWNSFAALGMDSGQRGGLSENVLATAKSIAANYEKEIKVYQDQIEQMSDYLNALNIRARSATPEQFQNLKQHALSQAAQLSRQIAERDDLINKINALSSKLQLFCDKIMEFYTTYFQEVYDPEIETSSFFDDSPAGFRLVYKHGREDPNLWSCIFNDDDYVKMLTIFFHLMQSQFLQLEELKPLKGEEIGKFFSGILLHIQSDSFIKSAYERCFQRGQRLFRNFPTPLPKNAFRPYVYFAGGTMMQLTNVYFKREQTVTVVEKNVQNTEELLAFILDTFLDLPLKVKEEGNIDPFLGLLASCPTHAFVLRPYLKDMQNAIRRNEYPFTYIRDYILDPARLKLQSFSLMPFEQGIFLSHLLKGIQKKHPLISFKIQGSHQPLSCQEFKKYLVKQFNKMHFPTSFSRQFEDLVDYGLFSYLPFFKGEEVAKAFLSLCDLVQEKAKIQLNTEPFF